MLNTLLNSINCPQPSQKPASPLFSQVPQRNFLAGPGLTYRKLYWGNPIGLWMNRTVKKGD